MGVSVASPDLPDQPDDPGRAERARDASADQPRNREAPDPDERGRVYEATRAHVSAETAEEASPGQRSDGTDQRSYWDEAPRFLEVGADLERRWPAEQRPAVDRSADPPGSYRSDGGFYLNPERHADTITAIGRVREAEPAISADVEATEQANRYRGWLEGFDCRLKGEDRLKEKVAEGLTTIGPDARPEEILAQVPDAIRYTFCLRSETYMKGCSDIKARLENLGYEMYQSRNSWDDAEYKGINTRWVTQGGQRFEVQFHTPESFHAKQYVTHETYERIRNPLTSDVERAELEAFQREVSSRIRVPDRATEFPNFKKEGF
jgi:hypothetical protein